MNLSELTVGDRARILAVEGPRSFRRRVLEMGLLPGTEVEVVRIAPLGDPMELRARQASLSIRHAEAAGVTVSELVRGAAGARLAEGR